MPPGYMEHAWTRIHTILLEVIYALASIDLSVQQENYLQALDYLRSQLDDVCARLADMFGLHGPNGRPRKAYIIDVLMRYFCRGCIVKALRNPPMDEDVDALFTQSHRLATGLLAETLWDMLRDRGYSVSINDEEPGEYGRPDIIIRFIDTGLIINIGAEEVIVEVKSGRGFSYNQVLRYIIERPHAILVLWRIPCRQTLIIDAKKHGRLMALMLEAAIRRGLDVLSGIVWECSHGKTDGHERGFDPQAFLDDCLSSIAETVGQVAEKVLEVIEGRGNRDP